MTKEELIKYHEETLECLSNMENSNCNYDCDKCHIVNDIGEHEITRETIKHLNNSIEFSRNEREILIYVLQKEIINEKLHLNQESEKYVSLNRLIEKLRM